MNLLKRLCGIGAALTCVLAASTYAGDDLVAVRYEILTAESDGEMVRGTMSVEVSNLTGGDLDNVDLRLDHPGRGSLGRGVLQFGSIPRSETRVSTGDFLLEEAALGSEEPIFWRIDYDDEARNHRRDRVAGEEVQP